MFTRALKSFDAEHYHASDLYCLAAVRRAAKRRDALLTYDARELYPFVAATRGRPWVRWFWRRFEARHIKDCHAVFTVSDGIADLLQDTYHILRPVVVHNAPETQEVRRSDVLRKQLPIPPDGRIVLHQGQMRKDRGCTQLVEAATAISGAHIVFLGDGPLQPQLQTAAAEFGIADRVHFVEAVAPNRLLNYTASADVGVTLLEDTCLNHRLALPNKLFEYLMAGLPVLGSDLPEIRGIITKFDVGLVADPSRVDKVRNALEIMLADDAPISKWQGNAKRVSETISWEIASHRFLTAIEAARTARHQS